MKHGSAWFRLVSPGVLALALAGCTAFPPDGPSAASRDPAPGRRDASEGPPRRTVDAPLVRALQDHEWTLRAATDAGGTPVDALLVAGHPFVLRFERLDMHARGGCNGMSAGWRLSPQDVLEIGRIAMTQKACEPALMAADDALAQAFAGPLQARVQAQADDALAQAFSGPLQARVQAQAGSAPPVLRLVTGAGRTLSFEGRATLASRFGAPTRMFLEVAPQRVPCTPPLQPPATCLHVREIRFDDQGLRIGEPGPWRAFHGDIAGHSHTPGIGSVLRINRYPRPAPASDVYELDLVVESRVEGQ